jgi:hypothetical protein
MPPSLHLTAAADRCLCQLLLISDFCHLSLLTDCRT